MIFFLVNELKNDEIVQSNKQCPIDSRYGGVKSYVKYVDVQAEISQYRLTALFRKRHILLHLLIYSQVKCFDAWRTMHMRVRSRSQSDTDMIPRVPSHC